MKYLIFSFLILFNINSFSQELDCCSSVKEVAQSLIGTWQTVEKNDSAELRFSIIDNSIVIDKDGSTNIKYEEIDINDDNDDFEIANLIFYKNSYSINIITEWYAEALLINFLNSKKLILLNDLGKRIEYTKIKDD